MDLEYSQLVKLEEEKKVIRAALDVEQKRLDLLKKQAIQLRQRTEYSIQDWDLS